MRTMTDEVKDIAERIVGDEGVISRIVTMKHFQYMVEGEEVIFTEDMRGEVERLAGEKLEEVTPEQYPGERVLRFPQAQRQAILSRLLAG